MAKIIRRYKSKIYGNYRLSYLKFGSYLGLAMSLVVLLQTLLLDKFQPYAPETFVTDFVMLVGIAWACYSYRENLKHKRVMFKELMLLGMGMGIVSSVIYALYLWVCCGQMFPDLVDTFATHRIRSMPPAAESAEAQYNVQLVRKYTAGDWAFIGGFRSFVMSIIIAFFSALIFANEKPHVYDPNNPHYHPSRGAHGRHSHHDYDRNVIDD